MNISECDKSVSPYIYILTYNFDSSPSPPPTHTHKNQMVATFVQQISLLFEDEIISIKVQYPSSDGLISLMFVCCLLGFNVKAAIINIVNITTITT